MRDASPGVEKDPVEDESLMEGEFAGHDLLGLGANLSLSLLHVSNGVGLHLHIAWATKLK